MVVCGPRRHRRPRQTAPRRGHHSQIPVSDRMSIPTPAQPIIWRPIILRDRQVLMEDVQKSKQRGAEVHLVEHGAGRRVEEDGDQAWAPSAAGLGLLPGQDPHRAARFCRKSNPGDVFVRAQQFSQRWQVLRKLKARLAVRIRPSASDSTRHRIRRDTPAARPILRSAQAGSDRPSPIQRWTLHQSCRKCPRRTVAIHSPRQNKERFGSARPGRHPKPRLCLPPIAVARQIV